MSTQNETRLIIVILSMFIGGIVALFLPFLAAKAVGFILIPLAVLTVVVTFAFLGLQELINRIRTRS